MKEYNKDDSNEDDDARKADNDSPASDDDKGGFNTPTDVAELLHKGRKRMMCPFNEKLLKYLPMILKLKSPLNDESGPPLGMVVHPTTRYLCVCGTVSFSL